MSIDTSKLKRYKPGYVHSNDGPGYISMLARDDGEYVRLDDVQAITSALEQALTQQRGEVSAGDAVFAFSAMLTSLPHVVPFGACAWATPGAELATAFNEANGLSVSRDFPQGLKFPEIAGKLLGIVEKAAAQEDTTPQPSADAVREDSARLDWIESQIREYGDGYTEPREAGWGIQWQQERPDHYWPGLRAWIDEERRRTSADELESLLGRGG